MLPPAQKVHERRFWEIHSNIVCDFGKVSSEINACTRSNSNCKCVAFVITENLDTLELTKTLVVFILFYIIFMQAQINQKSRI